MVRFKESHKENWKYSKEGNDSKTDQNESHKENWKS